MSLLYRALKKRIGKEKVPYPGEDEALPLKGIMVKEKKVRGRLKYLALISGAVGMIVVVTFAAVNIRRTKDPDAMKSPSPILPAPVQIDINTKKRRIVDSLNNGLSYYNQKNWEQAIIAYQQCIFLEPDNAKLHNDLGVVYYQSGQIKAAQNEIEAAIRLDSNYPEAHFNLAIILEEEGEIKNSMEHYKKFVMLAEDRYPSLKKDIEFYLHYW